MKEIPLTRGKVALVDDEDYERLSQFKWWAIRANPQYREVFYAQTGYRTARTFMHRMIMNPPEGMFVDHINGDGLDNRKSNLRLATHKENMRNKRYLKPGQTSCKKGVYWDRQNSKWRAQITVDGKNIYLGLFASEEGAGRAYDRAAQQYFGEFAHLNAA